MGFSRHSVKDTNRYPFDFVYIFRSSAVLGYAGLYENKYWQRRQLRLKPLGLLDNSARVTPRYPSDTPALPDKSLFLLCYSYYYIQSNRYIE